MTSDPAHDTEDNLVRLAADGDQGAFARIVAPYEERLRRQVRMRLDRRVQCRVDVSDVIQEVRVEAHARLPDFVEKRPMPFFRWLRFLTAQRVLAMHRFHLGAQARDARREVRMAGDGAKSTVASMAAHLAASVTSPSSAAVRAESEERLRAALDSMDPIDREVLCLRHFEQLNNAETAAELDIETSAASKRYVRALRRLKEMLEANGLGGSALQ
jgi:RNA polymerase sigma-70 factor (ECF subfamily)